MTELRSPGVARATCQDSGHRSSWDPRGHSINSPATELSAQERHAKARFGGANDA